MGEKSGQILNLPSLAHRHFHPDFVRQTFKLEENLVKHDIKTCVNGFYSPLPRLFGRQYEKWACMVSRVFACTQFSWYHETIIAYNPHLFIINFYYVHNEAQEALGNCPMLYYTCAFAFPFDCFQYANTAGFITRMTRKISLYYSAWFQYMLSCSGDRE